MGTGRSDNAVAVREGLEAVPELSPQQLQLVQQHFDRVCSSAALTHCCAFQNTAVPP